jgi:hypothetical protein
MGNVYDVNMTRWKMDMNNLYAYACIKPLINEQIVHTRCLKQFD